MTAFLSNKYLPLLFSFLVSSPAYAQTGTAEKKLTGSWISANAHYGFVIAHNQDILYLINGHTPGAEINFYKTTAGTKQWHRDYRNPEIGLSAFYISLPSPDKFGYGISLHPYINFPLVQKGGFALKLKASVSAGYVSKTFDRLNNFKNGVIGSHINGFVNLRVNAHHALGRNYRLEYGLGLSHFSNGAFKMPNLGINVPTLNMGLARCISKKEVREFPDTAAARPTPDFQIVCFAAGFKAQVQPPLGTNYGAFTVSASFDWIKMRKHRFLLGAEMGYNGGNIRRVEAPVVINKKSELLQQGIKAGYALRIGALELPLELGYYIHNICKDNGHYFHRIGVRYYCPNNLMINFTLKTHWVVADYWEWGLGYAFAKTKKKNPVK